MGNATEGALRLAIKRLHGLDGTHRETVRVVETFRGETVWEGDVYVFDVAAPKASACYAWIAPTTKHERVEMVAILGEPPVTSPQTAVRAWIVAKSKAARN